MQGDFLKIYEEKRFKKRGKRRGVGKINGR